MALVGGKNHAHGAGMAKLNKLVETMDVWLRTAEVPDYPGAVNGLQLANDGEVTRVACAVDACEPVVAAAVAAGSDLLLVHHGLFWGGAKPLVGGGYRKLKQAMAGNLAIYSSHLPLDVHPALGNNIQLARAIGLIEPHAFFPWKGISLGLRGTMDIRRDDLVGLLGEVVGGPVHVCAGGPERVRRVGVITGGAGGEITSMAGMGIDTFITGEGPHWSYTAAEEMGINLLYAGHYATETLGVQALAAQLETDFALPWTFLHHPSGL